MQALPERIHDRDRHVIVGDEDGVGSWSPRKHSERRLLGAVCVVVSDRARVITLPVRRWKICSRTWREQTFAT